jgi:hypothetical protein
MNIFCVSLGYSLYYDFKNTVYMFGMAGKSIERKIGESGEIL